MTIITFNLQNDFFKQTIDKKTKLLAFIKEENADIICFQELTAKLKKYLEESLENYTLIGSSRYQTNSMIDEYNSILVKKNIKILKTQTFPLYKKYRHAYFSIFPRVCTYVKLEKNNQVIQVYNTHLDHLFNFTRSKQLEILKSKIENSPVPTVITGDFNMVKTNNVFKTFVKPELINTGETLTKSTLKYIHQLPIDYILTTKNIECSNIQIAENVHLSDHYPLIAKVKIKSL